jgi:hypothetical protein
MLKMNDPEEMDDVLAPVLARRFKVLMKDP